MDNVIILVQDQVALPVHLGTAATVRTAMHVMVVHVARLNSAIPARITANKTAKREDVNSPVQGIVYNKPAVVTANIRVAVVGDVPLVDAVVADALPVDAVMEDVHLMVDALVEIAINKIGF